MRPVFRRKFSVVISCAELASTHRSCRAMLLVRKAEAPNFPPRVIFFSQIVQ